jgi:hypothetical protein
MLVALTLHIKLADTPTRSGRIADAINCFCREKPSQGKDGGMNFGIFEDNAVIYNTQLFTDRIELLLLL